MTTLPSQIQDDQEFTDKVDGYLREILGYLPDHLYEKEWIEDEEDYINGESFEIDEKPELGVIIKGSMSHDRFRTRFIPYHIGSGENFAYTLYHSILGLGISTEEFGFISTTPEAMEINKILDRATKIPNFFELI